MALIIIDLLFAAIVTLVLYFLSLPLWALIVSFIASILAFIILLLVFAFMITIFLPYYKKNKEGKLIERKKPLAIYPALIQLVCDFLKIFFKVKLIVNGKDLIPTNEPYIVVINHQSLLDPILFFAGTKKKNVVFIMKKEIEKIPLVGRYLKNAGFYYVNRQNNREGLVTIINSINAISRGIPVGVFIEGTRSFGPELGEFHDATLKMALKTQCKVVVCCLDNCYKISKNFPFKKTKVLLKVCDVLDKSQYEGMNTIQLGEKIKQIMQKNLVEERL